MRVEDKRQLKTTKMRNVAHLCCKTLIDKIRNDKIHEMTEVEGIEDFLKEQRLHWLDHV